MQNVCYNYKHMKIIIEKMNLTNIIQTIIKGGSQVYIPNTKLIQFVDKKKAQKAEIVP